MNDAIGKEFDELCDKLADGQLSAEEMTRLETLFLSSAQMRREFAQRVHLHASLKTIAEEGMWPAEANSNEEAYKSDSRNPRSPETAFRSAMLAWTAAAVTAIALSLVVVFQLVLSSPAAETFATISTTEGSRWASTTLPTTDDARIGSGRVRLADGIATFHFDNGAKVDIEGPADFEILSAMKCRLYDGKLVATITPQSKGFTVDTPDAVLIDQGTSFGVNVTQQGVSSLQVFEGLVDVQHRETGEKLSVKRSESIKITPDAISKLEDVAESLVPVEESTMPNRRQTQVSTATGGGKEQWIIRDSSLRYGPEDLLMVKLAAPHYQGYDRKIYLQFDLTEIDLSKITSATLSLSAAPSGIGYASRMGDAEFEVLAITEDPLDDWSPETINWKNAPGNVPAGDCMNATMTRSLGTFIVPRGRKYGTFNFSTDDLLDAIRSDGNRLVTLVIVPHTHEKIAGALVHGFAASSHPMLPPPTLRIGLP